MKKVGAILILFTLLISSISLISAQEAIEIIEGSEAEDIIDVIEDVPITKEGKLDEEKIQPYKSKAEERIEKLNEELKRSDPFFMFVFEIPLRASWQFIYLFFVVLLSFSIFHNISNWFGQDKEWLNLILGFGTTFALGKLKVYLWVVTWILKITNTWWWKLIATVALIFLVIIVTGIGGLLKKLAEKHREKAESKKLIRESKEVRGLKGALQNAGRKIAQLASSQKKIKQSQERIARENQAMWGKKRRAEGREKRI